MSKKVYVYDANTKELIYVFIGVVNAKKQLKMGYDTLKRYCQTHEVFKDNIFSYNKLKILKR